MKNRPYSFDLFDPEIPRHYLLAADNEKEKEEWVASFSMVLNQQPVLESSLVSREPVSSNEDTPVNSENTLLAPSSPVASGDQRRHAALSSGTANRHAHLRYLVVYNLSHFFFLCLQKATFQ